MTTFAIWCVAGFFWVFFFPAKTVPSQWAQLLLGGPLIWATMGMLYWRGTRSVEPIEERSSDRTSDCARRR